jgi:hypothetical protein
LEIFFLKKEKINLGLRAMPVLLSFWRGEDKWGY